MRLLLNRSDPRLAEANARAHAAEAALAEAGERHAALEAWLDHERLFPVEWANRRVRDRLGNAVQAGPFAGMQFPDWGITGIDAYGPRVIGCYEEELHAAVEAAIAKAPPVVVNVGSAEGYYAIGFARRLPEATVHAFDTDAGRIAKLREIAALNGVVVVARAEPATHETLADDLEPGSLLFVDCDGPEDELLVPSAVPVLGSCHLIVETHDLLKPGITERLLEAFTPSHHIERIDTRPRYVGDYPQLGDIPLVTRQLAISEFREGPQWFLVMTPRG